MHKASSSPLATQTIVIVTVHDARPPAMQRLGAAHVDARDEGAQGDALAAFKR